MGSASVFDHPWLGGLFADPDMAALWSAEAQLGHMLAFEAAWSRALGAAGLAPAAQAEAAAQAVETCDVDLPDIAAGMAQDGVPVPRLVKQLKAAAGGHAEAVHRGATSQDVVDTALALVLKRTAVLLDRRLADLGDALDDLSARFGDVQIMGRTRMQAALPIRAAVRIAEWRLPLADHRTRLAQLRPRVEQVQIGGAAGDRAALKDGAGTVVASVAAALGLAPTDASWHARRDGVAEFVGVLSLISGTLGKMGQDVCLMAQQGIGEIALSGGGGSSAMPHKQNPVLAELLVTLARFNAVQVSGLHQALVHEQERSGAAWALEWMILPQMAQATGRALVAAQELVGKVQRIGAE